MSASSTRQGPLFALGRIVATPGALRETDPWHWQACLRRHVTGDFGTVCAEDAETNRDAITNGNRILSAYPIDSSKPAKGFGENCFWIITESDRSVTTILLPWEY